MMKYCMYDTSNGIHLATRGVSGLSYVCKYVIVVHKNENLVSSDEHYSIVISK